MATTDSANQHLSVTAFWEVNSGEEGAVAALLKDFSAGAARAGVKEFQIHQNRQAAGNFLLRGVRRRGGVCRSSARPTTFQEHHRRSGDRKTRTGASGRSSA